MKVQYDPDFLTKLKKVDIRIHKSFKQRIRIFLEDPDSPQLNNHLLRKPYLGYRSIDITVDYRAFYEVINEGEEIVVYFSVLGTHDQLYRKSKASTCVG